VGLTSNQRTFNCTSIVPVARSIVDDLGSDATGTRFAAVLPVTIWELGEAVGPLLIGPLSELYGRYPLMNACNMVFIAGTVLAALSGNMPLFISSRALTGMAVASNVLNPAIIGDIFPPEQRGTAMSLIGFAPIIGGTAGPAFSGYVDEILGWRAVLWVCVSLAGLCELVFFVYFRETYKVKILRRRREAARTREALKNPGPKDSRVSAMSREGGSVSLLTSVTRPVAVLASSIVLVALSLFGSFVYSQFYVLATTLPIILEDVYGLSPAAIGSAFLANGECWKAPVIMHVS
jgi:MFS family permease